MCRRCVTAAGHFISLAPMTEQVFLNSTLVVEHINLSNCSSTLSFVHTYYSYDAWFMIHSYVSSALLCLHHAYVCRTVAVRSVQSQIQHRRLNLLQYIRQYQAGLIGAIDKKDRDRVLPTQTGLVCTNDSGDNLIMSLVIQNPVTTSESAHTNACMYGRPAIETRCYVDIQIWIRFELTSTVLIITLIYNSVFLL